MQEAFSDTFYQGPTQAAANSLMQRKNSKASPKYANLPSLQLEDEQGKVLTMGWMGPQKAPCQNQ